MRSPVTTLLHPTPWRLRERMSVDDFIDHHSAGFDLLGDAFAPCDVAGEDASGQAVEAIVRQAYCLVIRLEGHDGHYWTKRLFSHQLHRMIYVCDDGWLMEPTIRLL